MKVWFGLFGAPFAWAVQHVSGYALTEATCGRAGRTGWDVHLDAWSTAVFASAAVVALAAGVVSLVTFRATRSAGEDLPPARIHFLSVIGIAITPLFLAMILMSGLGSVLLDQCRQG
jgi:Mn2+/Fe2+ NRAMP family transporter